MKNALKNAVWKIVAIEVHCPHCLSPIEANGEATDWMTIQEASELFKGASHVCPSCGVTIRVPSSLRYALKEGL